MLKYVLVLTGDFGDLVICPPFFGEVSKDSRPCLTGARR